MSKREKHVLLVGALWIVFFFLSGSVYLTTQRQTGSVGTVALPANALHLQSQPTFSAKDGITVNIIANLVTATQGFYVSLEFDPKSVRPVVQDQGVGSLGDLFPLSTKAVNNIVTEGDHTFVRIMYTQFSPLPPVVGIGTLASVRFEPLTPGETVIRLTTTKAAEVIQGEAHYIPLSLGEPDVTLHIAQDLSGTVGQGAGPTIFSPFMVAGFVAGLFALLALSIAVYRQQMPRKRRVMSVVASRA